MLSRVKQKLIRMGLLKPPVNKSRVKPVSNSPVLFHPDHLNINHFSGWVVGKVIDDTSRPRNLKILRGDTVVGESLASMPRVDVLLARKGPLNCGYQFRLYWRHFDEGLNKCKVLADGEHVADLMLYVTVKDLLIGQADELARVLKK